MGSATTSSLSSSSSSSSSHSSKLSTGAAVGIAIGAAAAVLLIALLAWFRYRRRKSSKALARTSVGHSGDVGTSKAMPVAGYSELEGHSLPHELQGQPVRPVGELAS